MEKYLMKSKIIIFYFSLHNFVMSSNVFPFVSGTSFHTKIAATTHTMPNIEYVPEGDQFNIETNVELTMKFEIHWKATAIATAAPRIVLGKISAINTHAIGPQLNMKLAV